MHDLATATPLKPAIFLDRDGTINVNTEYLIDFRDFQVLPHVEDGLLKMQTLGYTLFVVSNQSGVARGFFDLNAVMELNWRIRDYFAGKGIILTDMMVCPHYPGHAASRFSGECNCRKPKPGMILNLVKRYHIDVKTSFMVGDRIIDAQAGQAAGVTGVIIGSKTPAEPIDITGDFREFPNLMEFALSLASVTVEQGN